MTIHSPIRDQARLIRQQEIARIQRFEWTHSMAQLREAKRLKEIEQSLFQGEALKRHSDSVPLIKYTAQRGMRRRSMERIWGKRLVEAVLGSERAER